MREQYEEWKAGLSEAVSHEKIIELDHIIDDFAYNKYNEGYNDGINRVLEIVDRMGTEYCWLKKEAEKLKMLE